MTAEEGTRPSKTFRIFVSSTLSDLKAERDALQRYVFPRLSEPAGRWLARLPDAGTRLRLNPFTLKIQAQA